MIAIEFMDKIPDDLEERMRADLVNYERGQGIDVNYRTFSVILKINADEVVGILNAYTAFSEVYIDDIWIDSSYRNQGYGQKLIEALETHFKGQGFNNINLVTSHFQAPEFYKKCGFELEFVRKNLKNPQLTKYFFVKYFNDEIQTQGLILP